MRDSSIISLDLGHFDQIIIIIRLVNTNDFPASYEAQSISKQKIASSPKSQVKSSASIWAILIQLSHYNTDSELALLPPHNAKTRYRVSEGPSRLKLKLNSVGVTLVFVIMYRRCRWVLLVYLNVRRTLKLGQCTVSYFLGLSTVKTNSGRVYR